MAKVYWKSDIMNKVNEVFVNQVLEIQAHTGYTPEQKLAFIDGLLCLVQEIDEQIDEN